MLPNVKDENISYHGSALRQRRAQLSDEVALKRWAGRAFLATIWPYGKMVRRKKMDNIMRMIMIMTIMPNYWMRRRPKDGLAQHLRFP